MAMAGKRKKTQRLTGKQVEAIKLLLAGQSQTSVCRAVSVHSGTLYTWLTEHEAFKAELAKRREELIEANVERVRDLHSMAIDQIEAALRKGDNEATRVAMWLLDRGGIVEAAGRRPEATAEDAYKTDADADARLDAVLER
jgi:transposase-like protein